MELHGKQIIGHGVSAEGEVGIQAVNPATLETLPSVFRYATDFELEEAVSQAVQACGALRTKTAEEKAVFLETIAEEIEADQKNIIKRCEAESGLPEARLQGETGRTTGQIRLFASLVREGHWVDARIDRAMPKREPAPRPDMRLMLIPIGPVVVFGASNFPLAFSTAGGDTVSALAAGNPVIVKAHSSHLGTAELVAMAIQRASIKTGMPPGTFSLLHGPGAKVGMALVRHPSIRAVGFTGSQKGGRALFDAASARPHPIPVYAEMASINPVFILPSALNENLDELASGLHQSATLGVGQFCTNPGLVVVPDSPDARVFIDRVKGLMSGTPRAVMLNKGIRSEYEQGVERLKECEDVTLLYRNVTDPGPGRCHADAAMFQTDARSFLANPVMHKEVFGPSTLVVTCSNRGEFLDVAKSFEGELTATIHCSDKELKDYGDLASVLETRVGRLVFNGFPTGVEVGHSTNHGGPYPATTDVHSTSVGTAAIFRFARPICYQDCPNDQLPEALKDENPQNIWRKVDGKLTKEPL